tara:strand:- start:7038 stop:7886 length:849 start_codon:yes stop_codon:yes gene_type:complete
MVKIECTHNAGFFSCSIAMLDEICRQLKNLKNVRNELSDNVEFISTKQYIFYKPVQLRDKDIRDFFFRINENNIIFNNKLKKPGCMIAESGKCFRKIKNIENAHHLTRKYFCLTNELMILKENIINEYKLDLQNICGVYYRATDKCLEVPIPSTDEYIMKAKEILINNPEIKFLVQSDSASFIMNFQKEFPADKIIIIDEYIDKGEYPLHRRSKIKDENKIKIIQHFLVIVNILSECNMIIYGCGNVSLFIALLRGELSNTYQAFIDKRNYKLTKKKIVEWV